MVNNDWSVYKAFLLKLKIHRRKIMGSNLTSLCKKNMRNYSKVDIVILFYMYVYVFVWF